MSGPISDHDENALSVTLTFDELAFLSAVSGCKELYLADSSVQKITAEDVLVAIQNGRNSLELRGMVTSKSPNDLMVDNNLYQFFGPVLFPDWVLRMETYHSNKVESMAIYYRRHHLLVERGQGLYIFTMFREVDLLQQKLLINVGVANQNGKGLGLPNATERSFITRLIFTQFNSNQPLSHKEITLSGNDNMLWIATSNGLELSVTAEQIKSMKFI